MDAHSITQILILIILIAVSAFFSATETAFSSLNKAKIKTLAQENNKKAILTLKLSEDYDTLLSTILIGNNIVNIAATSIATVLFVSLLKKNGAIISTVTMTILVLLFGEITPKSLAKVNAENYAMSVSYVLNFLNKLFTPINYLILKFKNIISKLFKMENDNLITEDELMNIVDEAELVGGIDETESELLRNVLEFNDVDAGEILTPRTELTAVDITDSIDSISEVFKESGYSRLPVYDETIDNIVGIILEKDFYNVIYGTRKNLDEIIKPVDFIPPSIKISELLKKIQRGKSHMAVVVDEFGGTEGIITLEDILEELVGDIWDEHDIIESGIQDIGNSSYLVPTTYDLWDFFERFEVPEPETESSTINGWVMEMIDKVPAVGDSFIYEKLIITVTKTDGPKADEIKVKID